MQNFAIGCALTGAILTGCAVPSSLEPADTEAPSAEDTASSQDALSTRHDYVGAVTGTNVRVGIAFEGDEAAPEGPRVALFFCGHGATLQSHTRWFRSTASSFEGAGFTADGWTARITARSAGLVRGTLDTDANPSTGARTRLQWTAQAVAPKGYTGLFETKIPGKGTATVIVSRAGIQGAFRPLLPLGLEASAPIVRVAQITPLRPEEVASVPAWRVSFPRENIVEEAVVTHILP